MKFSELSSVFLFTLNNKKYTQIDLHKQKIDYPLFLEDFHEYVDINDNFALSLLPSAIPKNIYQNVVFIRKYYPDMLVNEMNSTKILVYYGLIYSSQVDLIKNPHLRAEIFDILIYLFVMNSWEKNTKSIYIFNFKLQI